MSPFSLDGGLTPGIDPPPTAYSDHVESSCHHSGSAYVGQVLGVVGMGDKLLVTIFCRHRFF